MRLYYIHGGNELRDLQERITSLLHEYGVLKAGIFGSRARGDAHPESDVDLLVEFENGRSLLDLVALGQDLAEMLGTQTDVITYASIHPLLRDRILADEVRIL